jgi:hypothetical protein
MDPDESMNTMLIDGYLKSDQTEVKWRALKGRWRAIFQWFRSALKVPPTTQEVLEKIEEDGYKEIGIDGRNGNHDR